MSLRKQIAWSMGATLGIMVMMASMSTAHASFNMRFKANWKVHYADGNIGNQVVNNGEETVPIGYVWYSIFTGTGSTFVKSGVLSGSGYTSYFTAENNQNYWLQLTTIIERDGRIVVMEMPVNGSNCRSYDSALSYYFACVQPTGVPNNTYKTVSRLFGVSYNSTFHAAVGRVAAQVLLRGDLMGVPEGKQWRIRASNPGPGANWYLGDDRFCFSVLNTDLSKFVIAHEFAHAIADHGDHFITGGIDPPNLNNPHCHCPSGGAYGHCLTMWLNIDGAQSEGFAEFGATALMNTRTSSDPKLGYFVEYTTESLPSWLPSAVLSEMTGIRPYGVGMNSQYKYMENACGWLWPVDHGTEWDWMTFFWQIWTIGPDELEIDQIVELWPSGASFGTQWRQWEDIRRNAQSDLSPTEYQFFLATGLDNGINH